MINSIYTHREIFLRELISNASDALDKLYYKALTEHLSDVSREELGIDLALDKEARLLIIRDNGIGMTKEELENNLGVIARSGSRAFRQDMGCIWSSPRNSTAPWMPSLKAENCPHRSPASDRDA